MQLLAKARAVADEATPDRRVVPLPDGRLLGYGDYGNPGGLPIFGLHGTPGSRLMFRLADGPAGALGIRLLAPERPGFGICSSSWPHARRLCR